MGPSCGSCVLGLPDCLGRTFPAMCRRVREGNRNAPEILRAQSSRPDLFVAPPPSGLPPAPIPRRPDGRISVGILSACCFTGGAERWMATLMRYCCPEAVHWQGIAHPAGAMLDPAMRDELADHAPVRFGADAIDELYATCEVVLSWGISARDQRVPGRRACKVAVVSHGSGDWTSQVFGPLCDSDATVAVSEVALRPMPPGHRARAVVLENGVDRARLVARSSRAEVRRSWGVGDGDFVPLFLGRLSKEKDPVAFVEGMAALGELRPGLSPVGVMAGDGLDGPAVRKHADRVARGRVRFAGVRSDVGDCLRAADALVLPSREEAGPLAVMEAWTLGVPVVATPVGMFVEPRYRGLARLMPEAPTGDDVARALLADLATTERTRERCHEARKVARERFSGEAFGRRWTDFLRGLARPGEAEVHR